MYEFLDEYCKAKQRAAESTERNPLPSYNENLIYHTIFKHTYELFYEKTLQTIQNHGEHNLF